jgi:glycosyltransferase involved in cell wall biosynthesis
LLFSLLQHAGAYFHGHSVGGTNPALVQALACGAPVVARDTIYNREVLGEQGTFVPPDAEVIARVLLEMLESEEARGHASANSKARSGTEYTWDSVCAAYDRELAALAGLEHGGKGPEENIEGADGEEPGPARSAQRGIDQFEGAA